MIITIALAVITADNKLSSAQRLVFLFALFAINVAFYTYWILSYLKVFLLSLQKIKIIRKFLEYINLLPKTHNIVAKRSKTEVMMIKQKNFVISK